MAECRNIALRPHSRDEITQGALRASHFWGSRTEKDRMVTTWTVQIMRTVIASISWHRSKSSDEKSASYVGLLQVLVKMDKNVIIKQIAVFYRRKANYCRGRYTPAPRSPGLDLEARENFCCSLFSFHRNSLPPSATSTATHFNASLH